MATRSQLENRRARREIQDWGKIELPEDHLEFAKGLAVDVLIEAKRRTPVRKGRLKRSWTLATVDPRKFWNKRGRDLSDVSTGSAALRGAKPFETIYVVNGDFRASFHEYGTEHHAGTPMLRPALQKVIRKVVKQGSRVRRFFGR